MLVRAGHREMVPDVIISQKSRMGPDQMRAEDTLKVCLQSLTRLGDTCQERGESCIMGILGVLWVIIGYYG